MQLFYSVEEKEQNWGIESETYENGVKEIAIASRMWMQVSLWTQSHSKTPQRGSQGYEAREWKSIKLDHLAEKYQGEGRHSLRHIIIHLTCITRRKTMDKLQSNQGAERRKWQPSTSQLNLKHTAVNMHKNQNPFSQKQQTRQREKDLPDSQGCIHMWFPVHHSWKP